MLLLLQQADTRHWRKQSCHYELLYRQEQAAHGQTELDHRRAAEAARAADHANLERVRGQQASINERTSNDFEKRLAAARTDAVRLRSQAAAAAADPRLRGAVPVPRLPAAAGQPDEAADQDRLRLADRLTATEQAIQLDELIKWVERQSKVEASRWTIAIARPGRAAHMREMVQHTSFPKRRNLAAQRWAWAAPLMAMTACTPAGLLTSVDRLTSAAEAKRVAAAVPYGADIRHKLDVWAPRGRAAEPLPVVVFFYGGGWAEGSRSEYGFAGAAYASKGFIAVLPDYRLVPTVHFPAFVEDGALAVKWVRDNIARYGGDPKRITLAGHSAGAYNAAMLALDPKFLRGAGVDPKIIRSAALLSGPYDFYPFTEARGGAAFGQWKNPAETQPITFARRDAPPLFLAHGTSDRVVLPRNAKRLAERLRQEGAEVELRLYPRANHVDLASSLSRPFRNRTPVLDESARFLLARSR